MLGVIFTEFVEMVELKLGQDIADAMIDGVDDKLATSGAYTAVGTYDHREIVLLVGQLSKLTDTPVPDLVQLFGSHLFERFSVLYPQFFSGAGDALDFLASVEERIHFQVRKLYPDAQLPTFVCERIAPDLLVMEYRSERPFADLAHGLIEGCGHHFGRKLKIESEPLPDNEGVQFTVHAQ
jgi:hypothetical protein